MKTSLELTKQKFSKSLKEKLTSYRELHSYQKRTASYKRLIGNIKFKSTSLQGESLVKIKNMSFRDKQTWVKTVTLKLTNCALS